MTKLGILLEPYIGSTYRRLQKSYLWKLVARRYYQNNSPPQKIWDYWSNPPDISNSPEAYTTYHTVSEFLASIVRRYSFMNKGRVLEIGCNVGRNLDRLFRLGLRNLEGIEISARAVEVMKMYYPDMVKCSIINNVPVEAIIKNLYEKQYSLIFTTAVLYHIHTSSEWIFPQMVRLLKNGGYILTIENEFAMTDWRHFPRNYRKVFEGLGMKQVEEINCGEVGYIKDYTRDFYARIFKRG